MAHILLVEDEVALAQFISLELSNEGYQVSTAYDGMTGLAIVRQSLPDLAILDWMLPGLSGIELCRRLRTTGIKIPIIMMTAKNEVEDRVDGLDAGADDYITKPFSVEELFARIRAHLRRTQEVYENILQVGELKLDRLTHQVLRGDRLIDLTVKEFDLLAYLMQNPQQVFTKEQILENVWGYNFGGDSNVIEVYIRYLRLKLEQQGETRIIHTVRGVGYVIRES